MKTKIRECKTNGRTWTGKTTMSIIRREFGRHAFFHQDNGLPLGFGQIFKNLPNTGSGWSATSLTDRVKISHPD